MNGKKEIENRFFYNITNYIWWFLVGSFYFWLVNIPLILVFSSMVLSGINRMNWLLVLALIPVGPALTALLSIMGKLVREKELDVTKDFFKAYKINCIDSLFFWTLELIALTILWADIMYFNRFSSLHFLIIVPILLLFICLGLIFYIFPILSRFYMKRTEALKVSCKYMVKRIYICLIGFIVTYITIKIYSKMDFMFIILAFISIICYVVMLLEKGMLQDLEEKLKNNKRE